MCFTALQKNKPSLCTTPLYWTGEDSQIREDRLLAIHLPTGSNALITSLLTARFLWLDLLASAASDLRTISKPSMVPRFAVKPNAVWPDGRKWRKPTARNNHMTHDFMAEACERVAAESRTRACSESEDKQSTDDESQLALRNGGQKTPNLVRWQITRTLFWWLTWEETTCSDGALNNGWFPANLPQTNHQLLAPVVSSKPVSERWGGSLIPFSCILSSSLRQKAF